MTSFTTFNRGIVAHYAFGDACSRLKKISNTKKKKERTERIGPYVLHGIDEVKHSSTPHKKAIRSLHRVLYGVLRNEGVTTVRLSLIHI